MTTRAELQGLVDSLPDGAVEPAHASLTRLQTWPPLPPAAPNREAGLKHFQEMQERMRRRIEERDPQAGFIMSGGTRTTIEGQPPISRSSFTYRDGGDEVYESIINRHGVEVRLLERMRYDSKNRLLLYALEVVAPDGTTVRHEHIFDVPSGES